VQGGLEKETKSVPIKFEASQFNWESPTAILSTPVSNAVCPVFCFLRIVTGIPTVFSAIKREYVEAIRYLSFWLRFRLLFWLVGLEIRERFGTFIGTELNFSALVICSRLEARPSKASYTDRVKVNLNRVPGLVKYNLFDGKVGDVVEVISQASLGQCRGDVSQVEIAGGPGVYLSKYIWQYNKLAGLLTPFDVDLLPLVAIADASDV